MEKYGIELPESTKKLIEKSSEKYICCGNGHSMRAGPFVNTNNKRSKKNLNNNNNRKTKPAANDGSKNDSNDEEVALTEAAEAVADSDEVHHSNNDDFAKEKEDENEIGLLNPPPKIQQLQRAMIEQKPAKSTLCAFSVPKRS